MAASSSPSTSFSSSYSSSSGSSSPRRDRRRRRRHGHRDVRDESLKVRSSRKRRERAHKRGRRSSHDSRSSDTYRLSESNEEILNIPIAQEQSRSWEIHPVIEIPDVDSDVVVAHSSKKQHLASISESLRGKKVDSLDILCQENIVEFVAKRRVTKGKKDYIIKDHFRNQEKEVVDNIFASVLYQLGLPFNIVNLQIIEVLCEAIGRYGPGYIPPSFDRLSKTLLEQHYEKAGELKHAYLPYWKIYGVTLVINGWTNRSGRSLLIFLVNCPVGTFFINFVEVSNEEKNADFFVQVIEEQMKVVGIENIVQICTDNASNYVLAGKKLMDKYPTLYWTPCATHCLNMLLEDISKISNFKKVLATGRKITSFIYSHTCLHKFFLKHSNKKELVQCGVTRFVTSFLTLQSLFEMQHVLRTVFVSQYWWESSLRKNDQGEYVTRAVLSTKFWDNLEDCLRVSQPLLQVLRLVDSNEKPSMGYIHAALSQAKQVLKDNFGGKEEDYKAIIDLMDRRMKMYFDHDLFGAGAFLNPIIYYAGREADDKQVYAYESQFQMCMKKMVKDANKQMEIMLAVESYKHKQGRFGSSLASDCMEHQQPMNWWDSFGCLTPALRGLAMHILGLTCSTSNYERNWSISKIIQTKRRFDLDSERLSKLLFINYNKALNERFQRRKLENKVEDFDPILVDDLNYSSEWITGKVGACNEFVYSEEGVTWAEVDEIMGA